MREWLVFFRAIPRSTFWPCAQKSLILTAWIVYTTYDHTMHFELTSHHCGCVIFYIFTKFVQNSSQENHKQPFQCDLPDIHYKIPSLNAFYAKLAFCYFNLALELKTMCIHSSLFAKDRHRHRPSPFLKLIFI